MNIAKLPKPRFEQLASGFSHCNAYACAAAAWLTYTEGAFRLEHCQAFGIELVAELCKGPNSALVLNFEDSLVIAFRGTNKKADWRTNLSALPATTPWGAVHRGFKNASDSFWPELGERVAHAKMSQKSIWLAGHSLGGALATMATVRLLDEQELAINGLYTFGQPPAGYWKFTRRLRNELKQNYFRVVNHRDAVVEMGALGGFSKHGGQLYYFDRLGKLHSTKTFAGELAEAAVEVGSLLSNFGSLLRGNSKPYLAQAARPVTSHGMEHYLQLLSKYV